VGAICRTAEAAGVSKIYLTGYTPAPVDQFGRVNQKIAKTALGAEKILKWEKVEDIFELLARLSDANYQLLALEQDERALDYKKVKLKTNTAVIVGNEVTGIEPAVLAECDQIAEIPMRGRKESLNVAVAMGIALFRWLE